jgi:outer membrane protein OmpA-like peptidoglycan-associated protein
MGAPEFIIGFTKYLGKVKKGSSDINASGEPGLGGSGGGKLKDPKKVTPPPTEITPEPEAKPEDGKEGKENKPAVDPTVTEKKVDQPLVEAKPKEVEKPAAEPTKPKDKAAKAGSKKAGKTGSKKSGASNSSGSRKAVKSGLKSNLSPEMLAKLSKVVTSDEDLGDDPYKGTALALTKKQKDVFKKQPRYGKGGIEIDDLTKAQLSKVAKIMKSRPKLKLEVNGFTCDLGTKEGNEMISKARAENVKKYLISKGVPASRVETKGNAFEKPIVNNTSEEARQTNRRVQFRFIP